MTSLTFADIQKAQALLRDVIIETPTLYSPYLSRMFDSHIFLKMENFQETSSFKERGAYVKLKNIPNLYLQKGVIAVSAGNHGQAVAYHAQKLQIPATIVMPLFTPPTKVGNTEKWGARVILAGQTLDESQNVAEEITTQENLTFIHPYDDPCVIAGQGTIGLEMLAVHPELEILLIPIGGGGLCAGIAVAAKTPKPSLKIYGVEVEGYASMAHALYHRNEVKKEGGTLAEGIAVNHPGVLPQALLKDRLEDILVVTEAEIERGVDLFVRKLNMVVEGAGAAGLAGLLHTPSLFKHKNVGIVVSGGNIDARLISSIIMRGQIHDGRFTFLRIDVPDVPGTLARVVTIIAKHQGNILEVKHKRLFYEIPIKKTELDIMVETRGEEHIKTIINDIKAAGFSVTTLRGQSIDG